MINCTVPALLFTGKWRAPILPSRVPNEMREFFVLRGCALPGRGFHGAVGGGGASPVSHVVGGARLQCGIAARFPGGAGCGGRRLPRAGAAPAHGRGRELAPRAEGGSGLFYAGKEPGEQLRSCVGCEGPRCGRNRGGRRRVGADGAGRGGPALRWEQRFCTVSACRGGSAALGAAGWKLGSARSARRGAAWCRATGSASWRIERQIETDLCRELMRGGAVRAVMTGMCGRAPCPCVPALPEHDSPLLSALELSAAALWGGDVGLRWAVGPGGLCTKQRRPCSAPLWAAKGRAAVHGSGMAAPH